jgi:hypothetical protein
MLMKLTAGFKSINISSFLYQTSNFSHAQFILEGVGWNSCYFCPLMTLLNATLLTLVPLLKFVLIFFYVFPTDIIHLFGLSVLACSLCSGFLIKRELSAC